MGERILIAFNRTRERTVAAKTRVADTPASRAVGLLGRDGLGPEEGLWIVPCAMIHTVGMRFPIDVLFLDREGRVRRVISDLKPWRLSPWVWAAHSVLELAGGTLRGSVQAGDRIEFDG
ncbi:MAG: hypothetical protein A2X36_12955 [Elusimicrobia bacterium GWA2_69_24]|nr:MAG: hypothetical protein A2X36_12955 [Elusimicrobia bacterium GWA2_69_24]HBL15516.1 DUF192 domain-containing protein [Elusimicrobiota bacterium]